MNKINLLKAHSKEAEARITHIFRQVDEIRQLFKEYDDKILKVQNLQKETMRQLEELRESAISIDDYLIKEGKNLKDHKNFKQNSFLDRIIELLGCIGARLKRITCFYKN